MHPLENVIWHALTTRQIHLGERCESASKFHKEVSLLGGLAAPNQEAFESISSLLNAGERVGLFLDETPEPIAGLGVVSSIPLLQMVRENGGGPPKSSENHAGIAVPMTRADVPEMIALTELTKPGPFGARTREMGDYFGIRDHGQLIAMAGERLRVPGHTEISAVCTHPDHLGRGYAGALITLLVGRILDRKERPFLHVRPENARAIALYERLGFEKRLLNRYVILQKA